jgi:hypothetical protein
VRVLVIEDHAEMAVDVALDGPSGLDDALPGIWPSRWRARGPQRARARPRVAALYRAARCAVPQAGPGRHWHDRVPGAGNVTANRGDHHRPAGKGRPASRPGTSRRDLR